MKTEKIPTIGETIDSLAVRFSKKGDVFGLFILEQALEQATATRSQDQRVAESDEIWRSFKNR